MSMTGSSGRSLTNVRPWILYSVMSAGLLIVALLVAIGAHRELSGRHVPPADNGATQLSGSDYYVSSNPSGSCALSVPGKPAQELPVGRTTMVSGAGLRLPGPYPNGTTLACSTGADLTQGAITRWYWLPEHGLLVLLVGAIPFAIGQTGIQLLRRRNRG